jgi:hypothetical protein
MRKLKRVQAQPKPAKLTKIKEEKKTQPKESTKKNSPINFNIDNNTLLKNETAN